jgi:Host cell surface-exposed lipoprotein
VTQPEGVWQNPQYNGVQPGFTPADYQPPTGYPIQQPPTQQFGAPWPQSPYETPQGSWQAPAQPGGWVPTPPSRPWFKKKRYAIPAGVLALGVLGAVVSPKQDTNTAPAAAEAAASSSVAAASSSVAAASSSVAAANSSASSASAAASSRAAAIASADDAASASAAAASSSAATAPKPTPTPKPAPAPAPKPAPAPAPAPAPTVTAGQANALRSAQQYLAMTSFSHAGLIQQLSSSYGDGFSVADATYAADHVGADWNQQAAKAAKKYLAMTSFSHAGLVQQLSSSYGDQYTVAQAEYGVSQAGL